MNLIDPDTKVMTKQGTGIVIAAIYDPLVNKSSYRVILDDDGSIITCNENEIEVYK